MVNKMVNPDNLPSFKESKRPLKFGEKTRQYSIRIPPSTVSKIKERKLDISQIVYDVVEKGLDPYSDKEVVETRDVTNVYFKSLSHKLVQLMINRKIDASDVEFLPEERALVMKIAKEVRG